MQEYRIGISDDNGLAIRDSIAYCKANGISRLVLEPGEYHVFAETAEDALCCVSNHGYNGFKRTAFLVRDMQNFEIDGSGCLIHLHGILNAFVIQNSQNITLRNCRVLTDQTQHGQFRVVEVGEDYVDISPCTQQGYTYIWGLLYLDHGVGFENLVYSACEMNSENDEFPTSEQCFGEDFLYLKNEEVAPNVIRIHNPSRKPKKGNFVVLVAAERYNSAILMLDSQDVTMEKVTLYSSYGVGFHGQTCRNITLRNCATQRYPEKCFSTNADATHFVGCTGEIQILDCNFHSQFDDGVNVHSVYTTVWKKSDDSVIVRYVHYQCRGIHLHKVGDRVEILHPKTLLPKTCGKISEVRELNTECTLLKIEGDLQSVSEGDLLDDIDTYPKVWIEGCRFVNNRARGILMASREEVVIRNNYFRTPGTAIRLESDATYWYEAGCVKHMVVEGNLFDRCRYVPETRWGEEVININPRDARESGRFFHGTLIFRNNQFIACRKPVLSSTEDVENFVWEQNTERD